jgi:hypothetical protein
MAFPPSKCQNNNLKIVIIHVASSSLLKCFVTDFVCISVMTLAVQINEERYK